MAKSSFEGSGIPLGWKCLCSFGTSSLNLNILEKVSGNIFRRYAKQQIIQLQEKSDYLLTLPRAQLPMRFFIVEYVNANALDVNEYIKYILGAMLDTDFNNHPELLDKYLPWSKELPEEFKLNHKHKKCLKK